MKQIKVEIEMKIDDLQLKEPYAIFGYDENGNSVAEKILLPEDHEIRDKQYNFVKDCINSFKKQINELEDKIDEFSKKYPEYPSNSQNVPNNYFLILKEDELEAKWVHYKSEECGKIGTWSHPSFEAWEDFRELLIGKLAGKK